MSRSGWWIEEYERGRARGLGEADAVHGASMGEAIGRTSRRCKCGYPDWPGQCPGPAACPVHGENEEIER